MQRSAGGVTVMDRPGERIEAEEDKLLSKQIVHFKNDFTLISQFLVSDREYFR